jgi:DNA-binding transcriptional MocR family regulator
VTGPVNPRTGGRFKYVEAAGIVRAQIANGILRPGASAPSGAELSRTTGYSPLTCRRGLRALPKEGALVPGPSPNGSSAYRSRPLATLRPDAYGSPAASGNSPMQDSARMEKFWPCTMPTGQHRRLLVRS